MKTIKCLALIFNMLCFCIILNSQDQVRIMDSEDESAGRFKTQLFLANGTSLEKVRGNSPTVEGSGSQIELVLQLKDLRWFEDKNLESTININKSDIVISDPRTLQIASSPSKYSLSPEEGSIAEIRFRVMSNGRYTLKIPFSAGKISGQYVQSFAVENLTSTESASTPVGSIANMKKEWREVDKNSEKEVASFIEKNKNNPIAVEERLIVIAERTLLRLQKSDSSSESDEEQLWTDIGDSNDQDLLVEFLERYPNSKYAEAAKAKLGKEANVLIRSENTSRNITNSLTKLVDNIYSLDLSHLGEVDIKISHPDDIEIFESGKNQYDLKVKGSKSYQINVIEKETGDRFDFNLDNRLIVELDKKDEDLIFDIQGGVSPFTIEFYKAGEEASMLEARFEGIQPNLANEIEITRKMLNTSGMNGDYNKVAIRDYTTQAFASFPVDLNVSPSKVSSKLIISLLAIGLFLGGAFMIFRSRKQKKMREDYKEKAKVFQQTQKLQVVQSADKVKVTEKLEEDQSNVPRKITISKPAKKFVPANGGIGNFVSSGKMKITKREVKGGRLTGEEFREVLQGDKYAFLDLTELWPDSAIKELYLSKECIKELGKFLKEENLDKAISEMEGAIPEVGGFLMGYHQMNEAGHIRVTMDEFVPFVPEYHDVFKIEIGTATLVQELGDAQDTHPDKDVIGWFHTHPGHGLFLSNSDLSVQRHFPQKFQIAMEIDSLTETLDTAFFTRKMDGTINNVEHRKKGAKWFSWKKIEKI